MRNGKRCIAALLILLLCLSLLPPTALAAGNLATPVLKSAENTTDGVKVTWGAVPGAAQYRVFRKVPGGSWQKVGDTAGTSLVDKRAASGTTYTYTVRCISADKKAFTSAYNKTGLTVTFLSAPALTGAANTVGGVKITWVKVPGAVQYRVFRKVAGGRWQKVGDTAGTSLVDKRAASGTTYTYTVRCISADKTAFTSAYDNTGQTVTFLSAPTLTVAANVAGGVKIAWGAVAGAEQYRVFRKTSGGSWQKVGDTAGTSLVDKRAASGTTYTYTVRCISADKTTFTSAYDSTGRTITYLTTPTLSGAYTSGGRTTLNWTPVDGAQSYYVYRRSDAGWQQIATVQGGDTAAYTDEAGALGSVYTVRACSDGVRSGYVSSGVRSSAANTIAAILPNTATARKTSQIVVVAGHNLTLWNKAGSGLWSQSMDVYCGYGRSGLRLASARSEGDGTTPVGSFPLILAFGTGGNPGTAMAYRQITPRSYWSAANDSTYNTWVESSTWVRGEHLADYYQYKYALAVGFNINPAVYGKGSAIFVHCKSTDHWYTAGCVSLEESSMLALMRSLRNGAYIVIVPDAASLADY